MKSKSARHFTKCVRVIKTSVLSFKIKSLMNTTTKNQKTLVTFTWQKTWLRLTSAMLPYLAARWLVLYSCPSFVRTLDKVYSTRQDKFTNLTSCLSFCLRNTVNKATSRFVFFTVVLFSCSAVKDSKTQTLNLSPPCWKKKLVFSAGMKITIRFCSLVSFRRLWLDERRFFTGEFSSFAFPIG